MKRPSIIARLLRFAPIETLMALLSGFFSAYGINSYNQFVQNGGLDLAYTPLIFIFGQWPFFVTLLVAVLFAFRAYLKADVV